MEEPDYVGAATAVIISPAVKVLLVGRRVIIAHPQHYLRKHGAQTL